MKSSCAISHDSSDLRRPRVRAAAQFEYMWRSLDVRQALPLIQAPTLIMHVRDNVLTPIEHGRYLADHIAGATFVELPGRDFAVVANGDHVIDEVAEFLTGERPEVEIERILTTVLFTDIVGSTNQAASLGDRRWRARLDAHDQAVRDQLRRFRRNGDQHDRRRLRGLLRWSRGAIRCTEAIVAAVGSLGIELRAGMHTGECEVRGDDLAGLSVHIVARVGALAAPGEILVSATVKDLVVGSGIQFTPRGEHELRGAPGSWKLYAVNT